MDMFVILVMLKSKLISVVVVSVRDIEHEYPANTACPNIWNTSAMIP